MHLEILNAKQKKILPVLKVFKKDFSLAGGTAIALQIGHRHSIDFDLFSGVKLNNLNLYSRLNKILKVSKVLVDEQDEYTFIAQGVKLTFLYYPYPVSFSEDFLYFKTADLVTLGALKAYTLGRRAKWKDYVDLYFIFKAGVDIKKIITKARLIFNSAFNEKIFYQQLAYFSDIDYSETLEYLPGFKVTDRTIKQYLRRVSLQIL